MLITLEITCLYLKQGNTLPAFALKLPNRIRKWAVPGDIETSAANAVIEIKQTTIRYFFFNLVQLLFGVTSTNKMYQMLYKSRI